MIARCWLLIGLAAAAAGICAHPAVAAVAIIAIGIGQHHINIAAHSGYHGQLARSRHLNDRLTNWLLTAPLGLPMAVLQRLHLNHHAHLGKADDTDRWYYDVTGMNRGSQTRFLGWLLAMFIGAAIIKNAVRVLYGPFRPVGARSAPPPDEVQPPRASGPTFKAQEVAAILITQAAIGVALWLVTGLPWAYGLFWLLPRFSLMTGLNAFRACLDHSSAAPGGPRMKTFLSNRLERFIVAPFNMNYHAEHHLFMTVPCQSLPAVRARVAALDGEPPYESVSSYWADFTKLLGALPSK